MDHNGNIVSWNEGAGIIEGYSSEETVGKHFSIFYSEEEINNHKPIDNLKYAVEKGSYQEEGWRTKKDGSGRAARKNSMKCVQNDQYHQREHEYDINAQRP